MSDDIFLSPAEVAKRLGVSRLTAVRWMHSGKLKGQKLGRKTVRMKASDLDAFMQGQAPVLTLVHPPEPREETAQGPMQLLDPDTVALAEKLRQLGERMNDVVYRALRALQAQDTMPASAPRRGDALSADERKAAVLPRLRAMHAQGLTLQAMVDQLYAEGVRTPTGKERFQKGTLANWLNE